VRRLPPTPAQAEVQIEMGRVVYNARPGVRSIVPGPLYHSAPLGAASRTVPQADLTVLMPRFDPIALLEAIQEHRIEQMFAVPTMFVRLLKLPEAVRRKYDVSSLKFVMHAAAPCPADIKRQMIAWWGPIIWEFYGSTESLAVTICNSEEWLAHPGTVGRPYPGADVRIVGDDGRELPVGEIGEIFAGIPGAPDFTYQGRDEERVKVGLGGGRLITSGDVGYLDKDGFLYLCDRKRDMVISGGVNIYPAEIEAVLVAMPEVEDGCVFGIPDAEYGERLHAVVQPAAGAKLDAAAVRAYLAKHLANYKVPHSIEFRGDLPRQDSGKIYKRLLREPHWAGRTTRI
jgi:long-chain acyl-CoA synthetase